MSATQGPAATGLTVSNKPFHWARLWRAELLAPVLILALFLGGVGAWLAVSVDHARQDLLEEAKDALSRAERRIEVRLQRAKDAAGMASGEATLDDQVLARLRRLFQRETTGRESAGLATGLGSVDLYREGRRPIGQINGPSPETNQAVAAAMAAKSSPERPAITPVFEFGGAPAVAAAFALEDANGATRGHLVMTIMIRPAPNVWQSSSLPKGWSVFVIAGNRRAWVHRADGTIAVPAATDHPLVEAVAQSGRAHEFNGAVLVGFDGPAQLAGWTHLDEIDAVLGIALPPGQIPAHWRTAYLVPSSWPMAIGGLVCVLIMIVSNRLLAAAADGRKAQNRLAAAIDAFPEGFSLYGPDDRLVLANRRFYERHADLGDLVHPGMSFESFVRARRGFAHASDLREADEESLRRRLEHHRNPTGPIEIAWRNGSWMHVVETKLADGSVMSLATDITDLKRHQEALEILANAERHEFAGAAARALAIGLGYPIAGVAYLRADNQCDIIAYWGAVGAGGKVAHALAGTPSEQIYQGKDYYGIADDVAGQFPADKWLGEVGARSYAGHILRRTDGSTLGHIFAVSDTPDPAVQAKHDFIDIVAHRVARELEREEVDRALQNAKETAEFANRAKNDFLAHMSHELRTPLNAVMGFSEVIWRELYGPTGVPAYRDYAKDVYESAQHLLAIINDVLDVARIEAGAIQIEDEDVTPASLAESAVRMMAHRATGGRLTLANTVPNDLPALRCDPRLVKQVLLNFLSNAIKFTRPNGTVTIGAALTPDGGLDFSVADTGIGIAPEDLDRILQPFGQIANPLTRKHEGTGLGLPLSKKLIEIHGGTLLVDSQPGIGTTVTARFPASRAIAPGAVADSAGSSAA